MINSPGDPPLFALSGGIAELFYVLDLGDWFGNGFSRVVTPAIARPVGHLLSFAINGTLWGLYLTLVATLIALQV